MKTAKTKVKPKPEKHFESFKEYLDSLVWDKTARLDKWLNVYLGAEHTFWSNVYGKAWFISVVARTFKPGCPIGPTLIVEGAQGIGKSNAMQILAGAWFEQLHPRFTKSGMRDAIHNIRCKNIVEIVESETFSKRDHDVLRDFLSSRIDTYRPLYAKRVEKLPRTCVFVGTSSDTTYLNDEIGSTRYRPVRVQNIDLEALRRDRDQLWAEAVVRYCLGEAWY